MPDEEEDPELVEKKAAARRRVRASIDRAHPHLISTDKPLFSSSIN